MWPQTQQSPETAELLGDLHPLIEQIGSLDGLAALAGATDALQVREIATAGDLQSFLQSYHAKILQPLELPAIHRAFLHASRNELRELIAFDQEMATQPILQSFASASRRVGQSQLERLRPLRDHRFVQRYLAAVGKGEAAGWHTLIYGVTLAVYSLPLRQGLVGYAQRTTRGFIQSARRPLKLSGADEQTLLSECAPDLTAAVEAVLAGSVVC